MLLLDEMGIYIVKNIMRWHHRQRYFHIFFLSSSLLRFYAIPLHFFLLFYAFFLFFSFHSTNTQPLEWFRSLLLSCDVDDDDDGDDSEVVVVVVDVIAMVPMVWDRVGGCGIERLMKFEIGFYEIERESKSKMIFLWNSVESGTRDNW